MAIGDTIYIYTLNIYETNCTRRPCVYFCSEKKKKQNFQHNFKIYTLTKTPYKTCILFYMFTNIYIVVITLEWFKIRAG